MIKNNYYWLTKVSFITTELCVYDYSVAYLPSPNNCEVFSNTIFF